MNITHAVKENVTGDKLVAIFNRQKELMDKYHDIEKRSGLLQTESCPVNINDKKGQARIKDFAWRVMEEVGEALDANVANDFEHTVEELIDGLHFLTELTVLSGYDPIDVIWEHANGNDLLLTLYCQADCHTNDKEVLPKLITNLVMDLGMMCNCLKNKPWKQTNMITDVDNFLHKLRLVWNDYFSILSLFLKPQDIVEIYLKKSQVNKFRQRSNY